MGKEFHGYKEYIGFLITYEVIRRKELLLWNWNDHPIRHIYSNTFWYRYFSIFTDNADTDSDDD